ncbi:unnamed protein product [Thlaspi arvense]|uniref:STAS domain-containing protein n=1 Tax=Thlaspi arvense TaxID=13288 RepID=A0AAU9SVI0_THLAR|nr:unnamed protein product [Thlaspi arvense]
MKERDSESFESLSQVLPNTSNPVHMIQMAMANSGSSAAAPAGQDQLDRSKWLLDCPEPPSPWHELKSQVKGSFLSKAKKFESLRKQPLPKRILTILQAVFPIFGWCRNYKLTMFKNDLMAGLTLASLCIPQSIGYATLAKLDPQYGLCQGKKNKKLFWLPAIAPLISVVVSTLMVFLTKADEHGVKTVRHIKGGLNPISIHDLEFNTPHLGQIAKIALIIALVALTEAIAVGRSFAGIKGYRLDGNKEMVAIGFMNVLGSFTSCYAATGSFSRTAVNFAAGCETAMSNIVMAVTVFVALECLTRLLYYTPIAILASIILSALPGLIDIKEAIHIWKIDKFDFLALIGAFFGVLFVSVEIGLLVAVVISFAKIILISIRPGIETLGRMPGTDIFADTEQYPMSVKTPGVLIFRVKSALLCFANASFIQERIREWINEEEEDDENTKSNAKRKILFVVLDMSNLINVDTSGITALVELHNNLSQNGVELVIVNPKWQVIHKLNQAKFVNKIGGKVYLTIGEALDACFGLKV